MIKKISTKFGITSRKNVKQRYYGSMPYNYEIYYTWEGSAEDVWDLESKLKHQILKKYKYIPSINFAGYTESFKLSEELLKNLLINN